MGQMNTALDKKTAAEGKKLAAEHTATEASEVRKSQDYDRWVSDTGSATQSKTSKPPKK